MRILLLATILTAWLLGPIRAEDAMAPAQDRAAIQSVITQQLEAFKRDDATGAFGYAAPSTQGVFGNADNFMAMVKRGYPPVYRPHSIEFSRSAVGADGIIQEVELVGPDGLPYTARYTMEQEADGSWRIIACELLQSRRLGV